jgi:hypothetical protein
MEPIFSKTKLAEGETLSNYVMWKKECKSNSCSMRLLYQQWGVYFWRTFSSTGGAKSLIWPDFFFANSTDFFIRIQLKIHRIVIKKYHIKAFSLRIFCPPDVLSPWTFFPTDILSHGHLSPQMLSRYGRFVPQMFCLSGRFVPPDILSLRTFVPELFVWVQLNDLRIRISRQIRIYFRK